MKKIIKIVLTGGSCAGKTSAQKYIIDNLNADMTILLIPEAASILLSNGVCRDEISRFDFQCNIFSLQKKLENVFETVAEKIDRNVLIICDRGTCEGVAFLSRTEWDELLRMYNTTFKNELNCYSAVIYMPSVSINYPDLYLDTPIRNYTISAAQKESKKIYNAWKGHDKFYKVNNYSDFDLKLKDVLEIVKKIVNEI